MPGTHGPVIQQARAAGAHGPGTGLTGAYRPRRAGNPGALRAPRAIRPLRVLVDGRVMQDHYHGIGRYTYELLSELSRRDVELVVVHTPAPGRLPVDRLLREPNVTAVASQVPVVSLRSQWALPAVMRAFRPDVAFIPYHLSTPVLHGRVPVVSVMHDCILERYAAFAGRSARLLAYRAASRLAVRSATPLVAPSEATREDIRRFYGLELPPRAVLPHGVGERFFALGHRPRPALPDLPARYILHVGAQRPHKNQRVLVEALTRLRASHPDLGLVLVGQPDPRFPDDTGQLIHALGLAGRVCRYTQADDEMLLDLYANAAIFAYPSLVEGFGLPMLEAMAAGLPVVASDAEAVREIAGGGALIVPAQASAQWAQALDRVLTDPHLAQDLRHRARVAVSRHTWAESAERTLAILAWAAGTGTRGPGRA